MFKVIFFFVFINIYNVTSQTFILKKEYDYYNYLKLEDSVHAILKTHPQHDFIKDIDKFIDYAHYEPSYWGVVSICYSKNNQIDKSFKYLKKAVLQGFEPDSAFLNFYDKNFVDLFIPKYPVWRKEYLEKRSKCKICKELKEVLAADGEFRGKITGEWGAADSLNFYRQLVIDTINFKRVNRISNEVFKNYYKIFAAYDFDSHIYSNLSLYYGHFSHESLLNLTERSILSAQKGYCSWQLAKNFNVQLVFKFPLEQTKGAFTNFIYGLKIKNGHLDTINSCLTIKSMSFFLTTNPIYKVKLLYFKEVKNNIIVLEELKRELVKNYVREDRLNIVKEKYLISKQTLQTPSHFGWQLTYSIPSN